VRHDSEILKTELTGLFRLSFACFPNKMQKKKTIDSLVPIQKEGNWVWQIRTSVHPNLVTCQAQWFSREKLKGCVLGFERVHFFLSVF
jgi:hypothetical protein